MAVTKLVPADNLQQPVGGRPVASSIPMLPTDVYNAQVGGTVDSVRKEIDDAYEDMKTFHRCEPDEIMRFCGGHSARLSDLRVRIMRVEDFAREWKAVRVREIEPTLEELTNQYTIASRLHSVRELDWKMESGER